MDLATSGIITWELVTGHVASTATAPPQIGSFTIEEHGGKNSLIHFIGTDPDLKANIFALGSKL